MPGETRHLADPRKLPQRRKIAPLWSGRQRLAVSPQPSDQPQPRGHPPIGPSATAMRKEPVTPAGRAMGTRRHPGNAEIAGLAT